MKLSDALAGAARVLVFGLAYYSGFAYNAAVLLPLVVAVPAVVAALRRWEQPAAGHRKSAINTAVFWALLAGMTVAAIPRVQLSAAEYRAALGLHLVPAMCLMLLAARRPVAPGVFRQVTTAAGSLFLLLQLARVAFGVLTPEAVVMDAPFSGRWVVLHGGASVLVNHHFPVGSQRYAVDLVKVEDGARLAGPRERLDSYHCFGSGIYAPVDGEVVVAVDDHPDQAIGTTNRAVPEGNHIVLAATEARFVLLGHLQANSVAVSVGDRVAAGDFVARCGNSGNSSEPHLHIQAQAEPKLDARDQRTFPIEFAARQILRRNTTVIAPPPAR